MFDILLSGTPKATTGDDRRYSPLNPSTIFRFRPSHHKSRSTICTHSSEITERESVCLCGVEQWRGTFETPTGQ